MVLLLDVGNTQTVVGIYQGEALVHHWRMHTDHSKTADEYGVLLVQLLALKNVSPEDIYGAAIASVVPPTLSTLTRMVQNVFNVEPLILTSDEVTDLVIRYEHPRDVGADRIANALAVKAKYPLPAIVVDFGTATTFDCISKEGEYLGGVITPGVEISLEALFGKASKLPRISLERPDKVIGTNTTMSMQAGMVVGVAGSVDAIAAAIKEEMRDEPTVIATGGLATKIGPHCRSVDVIDELLTMEGLRLFYASKSES